MTVVLLARHGQTEWNRQGRRQGRLDSPLTEAGFEHARALAELAASLEIDAIFSSPLGRAVQTARVTSHRLALRTVIVDDLAELDHGAMSGLTNGEIDLQFPGSLETRAADKYQWRFPGGESYCDADLRAKAAVEQIRGSGAERALIVAHEMIGRMIARRLLELTPSEALQRTQPHDVVFRIDTGSRSEGVLRTSG